MPYVLHNIEYDLYICVYDDDCFSYGDEEEAYKFRTKKDAEKYRKGFHDKTFMVKYVKPETSNKPFTYKVLMCQARKMYKRIAKNSPFCAEYDVRDFIASKIDECVDIETNKKALKVREWDEYKQYAPMTRSEYHSRKKSLEEQYKKDRASLNKEWNTRGKNNKRFHRC